MRLSACSDSDIGDAPAVGFRGLCRKPRRTPLL